MVVDSEYGGEPLNDEKTVLNQMNQGSGEEETDEAEEFVLEDSGLKVILTQINLIARN